jgi:hypothetical protein
MLKRNQKIRCAEFLESIENELGETDYRHLFEPDARGTRSYSPAPQELEECDPNDLLEVTNLRRPK